MFFEKKVNTRSKRAMAEFLAGHFRYFTTNSWHHATNYANRVKLWDLGLTRDQMNRAFEIISADFWPAINAPISVFTVEMGGRYTIGVNGRSGGYLVLYRGEYEELGYKSRCRACGQLNYQAVSGEAGVCGVCGKAERVNLSRPLSRHKIITRGIDDDMNVDAFMEWSMSDLRDRVNLVRRFDRACDEIREIFIELLDRCEVIEEDVMVPKTVRRLACNEAHLSV